MEENNEKKEDILELNPDVVIDGRSYFYSPALQIANHICSQKYEEYRLTCERTATSATIYFEKIIIPSGYFSSGQYGEKKCIGVLIYDINKNRITLKKTNVKSEIHEFHADSKRQMDDCFGVQYELFKYLRDSDIIQINTIEQKGREKRHYKYFITKLKAVRNGRFLRFKGYGTQFFIPKDDFKCFEGEKIQKKKRTKKSK